MTRRRYKVVLLDGDTLPAPAAPRRRAARAGSMWLAWSWRLKLASFCYAAGALLLVVRFV